MSGFSIPQFVWTASSPGLAALLALGAEPPDVPSSPDGKLRGIGGYEMLERIGAGAMGTVWRARQLGTRREVALKLMNAASIGDERAQLRFQREVELTARLEHPHIARVYDSGIHEGIYYYAMELIEGKTLEGQIPDPKRQIPNKSQNPNSKSQTGTGGALEAPWTERRRSLLFGFFPFGHWNLFGIWNLRFGISAPHDAQAERAPELHDALALMSKIARAVQHAHERGVIHRDLKPSNIMIDQGGEPHVLDFGLAKAAEGEQSSQIVSQDGYQPGTLAYMSPEQAGGASVLDTRSDVYSLGVILYQLLIGCLPRDMSGSRATVLRRIESEEVLTPRSVEPRINSELQSLLLKALSLDPSARYATAGGLADDIDNYLRDDPLTARPQTLAYIVSKRARRYRMPLGLAAVVTALLLGTAVYAYIYIARARNEAVAAGNVADRQKRAAQLSERRAAAESVRADQQRNLAESRLTSALLAEADGLSQATRWVEAKDRYREAVQRMAASGQSTFAADSGLVVAYSHGLPPLNVMEGHRGPITATAFSPDGKVAISGGSDATVRVWDVLSGRCLRVLSGHTKAIRSLAVTPDGATLLSGGADNLMCQWDLASGRKIRDYAMPEEVTQIDCAGDSLRAVSSIAHHNAMVWDLVTGTRVCELQSDGRGIYHTAIFLPGQDQCATIVNGNFVAICDAKTGVLVRGVGWESAHSLSSSPNGRILVAAIGGISTSTVDAGLAVWDLAGRPLSARYIAHTHQLNRVVFSQDGGRIIGESADGTIRTFHLETGDELEQRFGDAGPFDHVAFSRDCHQAVSACRGDASDSSLRLLGLDASPAARQQRVTENLTGTIAFSADGREVAVGDFEGCVRVFDSETARQLDRFADPADYVKDPVLPCVALAFSPDGRFLLHGSATGYVRLWEISGQHRQTSLGHYPVGDVKAVAFSHDGRFAVSHNGNHIYCWEIPSGRLVRTIHADRVLEPCIRFSENDQYVISVSTHGAVVAFDRTTGAFCPTIGYFHEQIELTSGAAYGPEGMVLSGSDGDVVIWDGFTGIPRKRMHGHRGRVNAVAFSSDQRWAASASGDRTIRLWDTINGREIRTLVSHSADASDVKISPDDRWVASIGRSPYMSLVDLSFPRVVREFAPRLAEARKRLATNPDDGASLATLGEWYARCGADALAVEALTRARGLGAPISSLTLARCYWKLNQYQPAEAEFKNAMQREEAPADYLALCVAAVQEQGSRASASPVR